jgi:predicted nucleotidyltransferase
MENNQTNSTLRARFEAALESFVSKIKNDSNIRAVILCGSLANDTVWEKSDMDVKVLVRDIKLGTRHFCIEEDGLILNVDLTTEFDFKRGMERSMGGGFMYSFYAQARVVYAKDDSIHTFMEDNKKVGADDRALSFFHSATYLIGDMEKTEKWLVVKKDPLYAQLWCLKTAEIYANMRLVLDNQPPSREALLKLKAYDAETVHYIYEKPLSGRMTIEEVWDMLRFYKNFLVSHVDFLKEPVIAYMTDGEVRTVTALVKHFGMDSHSIYHIFDFLEEMGVVARVTEYTRITPKSRDTVEEVAFVYIENMTTEGVIKW